jgi:hypothetical protein
VRVRARRPWKKDRLGGQAIEIDHVVAMHTLEPIKIAASASVAASVAVLGTMMLSRSISVIRRILTTASVGRRAVRESQSPGDSRSIHYLTTQ